MCREINADFVSKCQEALSHCSIPIDEKYFYEPLSNQSYLPLKKSPCKDSAEIAFVPIDLKIFITLFTWHLYLIVSCFEFLKNHFCFFKGNQKRK